MASATSMELCEHEEVQAACLECLALPKKITPNVAPAKRATKSPQSGTDKISPLGGDMDMSLPVDDLKSIVGSESINVRVFPHYLKKSGWIYLRTESHLKARVKATSVIWKEKRTDSASSGQDLGPGIAIEVDKSTWDEEVDIDLGLLAKSQQDGFRYLKTKSDGKVVHYRGTTPIPESEIKDLI